MVRFLSITNSPLVRVTVVTLGAKLIVSPGEASRIACRNDPGPLSLLLVTVMVAAGVLVAVNVVAEVLEPVLVSPTTQRRNNGRISLFILGQFRLR